MQIEIDHIQKPRTPGELMAYVEQIRNVAQANKDERNAGNLKDGYYKQFFNEIVPLSKFAIHAYRVDDIITPVMGSQGFDAEVRNSKGKLVERVEIANCIDGEAVAAIGRRLVAHGRIDFQIVDPSAELEKEVHSLLPIIKRTAKQKSKKDYFDCTLVFNIAMTPVVVALEVFQEVLTNLIKAQLSKINFQARRVFVLLPSGAIARVDA